MRGIRLEEKEVEGFEYTGSNESKVWRLFHDENGDMAGILYMIQCKTCREHAHKIFLGLHSMLSLGIGKDLDKPEWKENFLALHKQINDVYEKAKGDGRLD